MNCPPHSWSPSPETGTYYCRTCGIDADVDEKPLLCAQCDLRPARMDMLCDECRTVTAPSIDDDAWAERWQGWVA